MAVNNPSGLTINNPQTGIQYTKVTDSSADWSSVANSTYFYDIATALIYFKDSSGTIKNLFTTEYTTGIFAIYNANGTPTFYSNLTSAITAAISGDTIIFYSNYTETNTTAINLKNGVNLNLNGFSYTLNNSGTTNAFQDNAVAVTCFIRNGTINRIGGSAGSTTGNTCLYITGASKIDCTGLTLFGSTAASLIINNSGAFVSNVYATGGTGNASYNTVIISAGTLSSSYVNNVAASTGNYVNAISNAGTIIDCSASSSAGNPAISNSGVALNCTATSSSGAGFSNTGRAVDCTGNSSYSYGFGTSGAIAISQNCSGYSSANIGISINGGSNNRLIDCTGYSTANTGISAYNGYLFGCKGISTASVGISLTNGNDGNGSIQNCMAISDANVGLSLSFQSTTKIIDTTIESKWNNIAGHALSVSSNFNHLLISNTYQVANASANCIYRSVSGNLRYADSQFIGSTTPVNSNTIQAITSTTDFYGNLSI